MANPLGAILAGLGGAAGEVGTSMDQKALLQSQMKRQAALDAIAKMQKLQEMGLTPTDSPDPTAPANLNPVQQIASQAQTPDQVVAAGQQMSPSDYAVHQIVRLPNATGGTDLYSQGPTPAERAEALADRRAQDAQTRQLAVQAAQEKARADAVAAHEAASRVDPAVMRRALDGDQDAVAEVLSKQPTLQTTFNRPDKTPPAITPYQQAELALRKQALDAAAARVKGGSDKDAQQMQMAQSMAQPAIDQLKGYYAKQENPGFVARTGSHIPLVGNMIVGAADPDYQKAQQSSEVLATQYVETLPKGRASPQLIASMQKQIAPELGDTPATRAQKLNTILTFERAIAKRAGSSPLASSNPFADLVPQPPDQD